MTNDFESLNPIYKKTSNFGKLRKKLKKEKKNGQESKKRS